LDSSIFDAADANDGDRVEPPISWYVNAYTRIAADLTELREAQPWLSDAHVVTPWQLLPGMLDTKGAHNSMKLEARFEFFGSVPMDTDLQFRSRVTEAYERNGSKYAAHDHVLVMGEIPLMYSRWKILYDFAKAKSLGGAARE
jgi:hypothetical protein